jgi:hypothetical protein
MKIVLHICCGVCAGGAASTLLAEGHEVTGYFYNPNIQPVEEYNRRLDSARLACANLGIELTAGPYDTDAWTAATFQLKDEPEGGRRCVLCYRIRLQQTYLHTTKINADAFTTTLTISPHKSAQIINAVGRETGGDLYLARDFKKKEGFKQAISLARSWGLYRQNYCGCLYSLSPNGRSP